MPRGPASNSMQEHASPEAAEVLEAAPLAGVTGNPRQVQAGGMGVAEVLAGRFTAAEHLHLLRDTLGACPAKKWGSAAGLS